MATDNLKGSPRSWARPLLPAMVPPRAAAVIVRECSATILEMAQSFEHPGSPVGLEVARELRLALGQMSEAARLWQTSDAQEASAVTFTEAAGGPVCASCGHSPSEKTGISPWVSVEWVAARTDVSDRTIRALCRAGVLVATHGPGRGRPWRIQLESATEWLESRGQTG